MLPRCWRLQQAHAEPMNRLQREFRESLPDRQRCSFLHLGDPEGRVGYQEPA